MQHKDYKYVVKLKERTGIPRSQRRQETSKQEGERDTIVVHRGLGLNNLGAGILTVTEQVVSRLCRVRVQSSHKGSRETFSMSPIKHQANS